MTKEGQSKSPLSCTASALINCPELVNLRLNTFFAFNISILQGNCFVKVFFFNTFCFIARLILNEKDFSPMMSIVKKSVFEAKFYTGKILKGYALINCPELVNLRLNTFFAFNISVLQGNCSLKVFLFN
jgi:hypothetical protein